MFNKHLSTEMIEYQNKDSFPIKLINLLTSIKSQVDNQVYMDNKSLLSESTYVKDIETLIKSRFNINVIIDPDLSIINIAAIIPFFGDYLRDFKDLKEIGIDNFLKIFSFENLIKKITIIEKERVKTIKNLHNRKGYIDLKQARVGGYLSELKHYLILDFIALFNNYGLSPNEVAAIILHEIGHAFDGLENHYKLETSNAIIIDILNEINNNNIDKATYIFKSRLGGKEDKNLTINSTKDRIDFYSRVAFVYINNVRTQLVNSKYDETISESLADSFVVRFGLGKDLTTALNTLHRTHGIVIQKNKLLYSSLFIINLTLSVLFFALFGPFGIVLAMLSLVYIFGSSNKDYTYDMPIDRYNRIKNAIINNLKDLSLPDNIMRDLLDQYIFITNLIEKSDYFKNSLSTISDYIVPSNIDAKFYIKAQQDIENGMNNILFIKAAQIKIS